jgi:uncharacterized RDD family membrane protein YckC
MIYDLQKASILKRISAFLLDIILMLIAVTGFAALISHITDIDANINNYSSLVKEYDSQFSVNEWNLKVDLSNQSFKIDDKEILFTDLTEEQQEYINNAYNTVEQDERFIYESQMMFNKTLIIVSISLFLAHFLLEFIVPLIFKNGQTVGKKIFSIAVIRVDGVRIDPVVLFTRSILGKYTIETMIPAFLILMHLFNVGTLITLGVLILIPVFEIILVIATKTNSLIHDIISSTVSVDYQSQMIFDSVEAKNEYQLRIHEEEAKNAKYF